MEKIVVTKVGKEQIYQEIIPQIQSLLEGENDLIANMANVTAVLKEAFNFFWIGFYLVKPDNSEFGKSLVLGPFQGPVACTRISYGRGVCGKVWEEGRSIVVPDVELFPGHIACNSLSRSEIVVPLIINGECIAILDIDSDELNSFDLSDEKYLKKIISFLCK
jgi:GAF domain-containing protein